MITIKGKEIEFTQQGHHPKIKNLVFPVGMEGLWLGVANSGLSVLAFNLGPPDSGSLGFLTLTVENRFFKFTGKDGSFSIKLDEFIDFKSDPAIELVRNIKVGEEQKEEDNVKNV